MVYYGKHSTRVDGRILKVRPEYLVANTAHSLWGEAYGYKTGWLLQDVEEFHEAGIKLIGYLTSGYGGKGSASGLESRWYTLEMNQRLVRNMAELDGIDGVFIDECSAYPEDSEKAYLKQLSDLAHNYGLIVWGNVGENDFDSWYFTDGGFDFINSTEQWYGQDLTPVQTEWGNRISVIGLKAGHKLHEAEELTIDAWQKGLAYCYVTRSYVLLPPWIEEFAARLRLVAGNAAA